MIPSLLKPWDNQKQDLITPCERQWFDLQSLRFILLDHLVESVSPLTEVFVGSRVLVTNVAFRNCQGQDVGAMIVSNFIEFLKACKQGLRTFAVPKIVCAT